jgi:hypothetical protein
MRNERVIVYDYDTTSVGFSEVLIIVFFRTFCFLPHYLEYKHCYCMCCGLLEVVTVLNLEIRIRLKKLSVTTQKSTHPSLMNGRHEEVPWWFTSANSSIIQSMVDQDKLLLPDTFDHLRGLAPLTHRFLFGFPAHNPGPPLDTYTRCDYPINTQTLITRATGPSALLGLLPAAP